MRLLITAALLLIAPLSYSQNEKKAQDAIKQYVKNEEEIAAYEEILFGPLEENIQTVESAEMQELNELDLTLKMDSLFQQVEIDAGERKNIQHDPGKLKRYNELKNKKLEPAKQEKGYKMLHMCKIKEGKRDWVIVALAFYLDSNFKVQRVKELRY